MSEIMNFSMRMMMVNRLMKVIVLLHLDVM